MRLDLDVRRLWRCPVCSTKRHAPGHVTFVRCHFCKEHPAMHLVERRRPDRAPPPPLDMIIDLHPDDVDAPAFVPVHLREPDPPPPVEAITQILTEPSAPVPEPLETEVCEFAAEPLATEPADVVAETDEPQERNRKKRRNRRQRRRNRSSGPAETEASGESDAAAGPPDADASFGVEITT
jgi:hypothetical protein